MLMSLIQGFLSSAIQDFNTFILAILKYTVLQPVVFPPVVWDYYGFFVKTSYSLLGVVFVLGMLKLLWEQQTNPQAHVDVQSFIARIVLTSIMISMVFPLMNLFLEFNKALINGIFSLAGSWSPDTLAGNVVAMVNIANFGMLIFVLILIIGLVGALVSWSVRAAKLIVFLIIGPLVAAVYGLNQNPWRWWIKEVFVTVIEQAVWAIMLSFAILLVEAPGNGTNYFEMFAGGMVSTLIGAAMIWEARHAGEWLRGMVEGNVLKHNSWGAGELALLSMGTKMAMSAVAPYAAPALAKAGLGPLSQQAMNYKATQRMALAQTMAQPQFAQGIAMAQAQQKMTSYASSEVVSATQQAHTMDTLARSSSPAQAAAEAIRFRVNETAMNVIHYDPTPREYQDSGYVQTIKTYQNMYTSSSVVAPRQKQSATQILK